MEKFDPGEFINWLKQRNGEQQEFLQAAEEIADSLADLINDNPSYVQQQVLQRLAEPDRIVSFRVNWMNDDNQVEIHRGWRVQQSNALGPYKGGLRFHSTVNESVLKFLAFEQCFKNALTGLPIGGGKGGADFDPTGRSDQEIMRFCQAYMTELHRHIGPNTDVPAGDINVGSREIGYLYGQYKKISNRFGGYLTGKDIEFGGSHVRTEATGFGIMYFLDTVLNRHDKEFKSQRIAVSGAGNVACYAVKKAVEKGACVISMSNSKGTLYVPSGINKADIEWIIDNKHNSQNVLKDFAQKNDQQWLDKATPWDLECDIACPCATQNELDAQDAKTLTANGCSVLIEGANMPCTADAVHVFHEHKVVYIPGKASNAGGVALSGLEMSQNASFERHDFDTLDDKLKSIMHTIHQQCEEYGKQPDGFIDYASGANRAAFSRLAQAIVAQGI